MGIKVESKRISKEDIKDTVNIDESLAIYGLADISKNIKESFVSVKDNEVRFLVDNYYQTQKYRISVEGQIRSIVQNVDGEGTDTPLSLSWTLQNIKNQEQQLKKMLEYYSDNNPVCRWAKSIIGVGPIISTALYAYFDISKCTSAGEFWSYAGLNDNKNPWIGKVAATKMVNDLMTIRDNRCYNIDQIIVSDRNIVDFDKNTFINEYSLNESSLESAILSGNDENLNKAVTTLNNSGYDYNDLIDYIMYLHNPNLVSDNMINEVVKALDGRRKFATIRKYSIETKEDSKFFGMVTKDKLIKYLSKPPYNTDLKVLMYNIGESFVKRSGNENSLYGRLYKERKAYELEKNEKLEYQDQAYAKLPNIHKSTEAYKYYSVGKLPPAHIKARAQRYATKIFISHFFECMYLDHYGKPAPNPYAIDHLGHVDYIEPEVPYTDYIGLNK